MKLSPDDRAAARRRCEEATEGPWYEVWDVILFRVTRIASDGSIDSLFWLGKSDAEFVAHSRTDLPRALDDLDEQDRVIAEKDRIIAERDAEIAALQKTINLVSGEKAKRLACASCFYMGLDVPRLEAVVRAKDAEIERLRKIEEAVIEILHSQGLKLAVYTTDGHPELVELAVADDDGDTVDMTLAEALVDRVPEGGGKVGE